MTRAMIGCVIALLIPGASAFAETRTVTGELISIMCYQGHGDEGRGEKHVACSLKCVKEGYEAGVLTDDGTIYKITGKLAEDKYAKLQELLTKRVVATGEVGEADKEKTIDAASVTADKSGGDRR
jgi:hypothetical protein